MFAPHGSPGFAVPHFWTKFGPFCAANLSFMTLHAYPSLFESCLTHRMHNIKSRHTSSYASTGSPHPVEKSLPKLHQQPSSYSSDIVKNAATAWRAMARA